MSTLKLAICDDIVYLCNYYCSVFEEEPDITFVGMSHNSHDCLEMVKTAKPDVLLLDLQMETDTSGINIIPKLKEINPDCKIIVLTIHEDEDKVIQAMMAGADNYVLKTVSIDNIKETVRKTAAGDTLLQPEISRKILNQFEVVRKRQVSQLYMVNLIRKLSLSEFEVLDELCKGQSYKDIADMRFVSTTTIRSQVSRILKKLEYDSLENLISDIKELKIMELFKI